MAAYSDTEPTPRSFFATPASRLFSFTTSEGSVMHLRLNREIVPAVEGSVASLRLWLDRASANGRASKQHIRGFGGGVNGLGARVCEERFHSDKVAVSLWKYGEECRYPTT